MSQWHSPDELNTQADAIAARMVEVSFWFGGTETAIARESLSFGSAGTPGAHPLQVAAPGRAWSQMLTVTVPDGVTVDGYGLHNSGGSLRSSRGIPPVTGPREWQFSVPIDALNNP